MFGIFNLISFYTESRQRFYIMKASKNPSEILRDDFILSRFSGRICSGRASEDWESWRDPASLLSLPGLYPQSRRLKVQVGPSFILTFISNFRPLKNQAGLLGPVQIQQQSLRRWGWPVPCRSRASKICPRPSPGDHRHVRELPRLINCPGASS